LAKIAAENAAAQAENARLQQVSAEQANALAVATALAAEREAAIKTAEEKVVSLVQNDTENELLFYLCGKSLLDNNNKLRLNRLAEKILGSENKEHVYTIFGFADAETGSKKGNEQLAEKRAKTVYDYLVSQGVPAERLQYKGCGVESAPFTKLVKEQNRTVVIY
jgi:outer membrane protein OmpA-like peptidoglycan-associated protein